MFRVQNNMDFGDYKELYSFFKRSRPSLSGLFPYAFIVLIVLTLLEYGLFYQYKVWWPEFVLLFALCFFIYFVVSGKKRYAKAMMKNFSYYPELSSQTSFEEDGFRQEGDKLHRSYRYSWVKSIKHGHGFYQLSGEDSDLILLPERCFVEGDPAAFGAFLEEKTGLKIKEIK